MVVTLALALALALGFGFGVVVDGGVVRSMILIGVVGGVFFFVGSVFFCSDLGCVVIVGVLRLGVPQGEERDSDRPLRGACGGLKRLR